MAETTQMLRLRIDKRLMAEADKVTQEIGTTPGELVRLMFKQLVKRRAVPFPLQADSPEDEVTGSPERRSKLWDAMEGDELVIAKGR